MDEFGTIMLAQLLGGQYKLGEFKPIDVHAFDVTPEMAESAMQGLPQYQFVRRHDYPDFIKEKFDVEPKSLINRIKDVTTKWSQNWKTLLVDRLDPIKEQLGAMPYMLYRLGTGLQANLSMFMRHGKVEWDGLAMTVKTTNKGFLTWLEAGQAHVQNRLVSRNGETCARDSDPAQFLQTVQWQGSRRLLQLFGRRDFQRRTLCFVSQ